MRGGPGWDPAALQHDTIGSSHETSGTEIGMSIRLGTVAPVGFHDFPPERWLPLMRQLGCEVVQVYRSQLTAVSRREIRDAIAAGGMDCDSLHGVYGDVFDPSSPLERSRRFAVEAYKAEGELALELGGPLVVVHCCTIRRQGIAAEERRLRVDQLRKSIQDLGLFGSTIGVRYAFENLPAYHPLGSDIGELAAILRDSQAQSVGMCFDTGHANMVTNPAEAVARADGRIIYVHLNDNDGKGDDHLMPTYGTVDMPALGAALHQARYDGTMMLEVFYGIEELQRYIGEGCADRLRAVVQAARGGAGTRLPE
jgi:sugar phosphate isomerase/epimerase